MKSLIILFLVLIAGFLWFVGIHSEATSGARPTNGSDVAPDTVVQLFCEFAAQGDFTRLRDLTSDYPEEYFSATYEELSLARKSAPSQPKEAKDSGDLAFAPNSLRRSSFLVIDLTSERFHRDLAHLGLHTLLYDLIEAFRHLLIHLVLFE